MNELAQPLNAPRAPALSASAETDQARAIAEVKAQMYMAKQFPRDEITARDKIINACTRKGLAEVAMYTYARGGTDITGPSIRLAEVLALSWGNIVTGWRELSRQNGVSEVEAYAWDIESNVRWPLTFQVKHVRDTKKGAVALRDERDIYEVMANQASRRVRACILKLIPGDILDDAVTQCEATMKSNADTNPQQIKVMVEKFGEMGVTKEMIEARIQRRLDSITSAQVVNLRKIYNSLRDGMSAVEDWFEVKAAAPEMATPATKKPDATAKPSPTPAPTLAPTKAATASHDPVTGEVHDDAALTLDDWIAEIHAVPSAEGIDHKLQQALAAYPAASSERGELRQAADAHKATLVASAPPKQPATFTFGE